MPLHMVCPAVLPAGLSVVEQARCNVG